MSDADNQQSLPTPLPTRTLTVDEVKAAVRELRKNYFAQLYNIAGKDSAFDSANELQSATLHDAVHTISDDILFIENDFITSFAKGAVTLKKIIDHLHHTVSGYAVQGDDERIAFRRALIQFADALGIPLEPYQQKQIQRTKLLKRNGAMNGAVKIFSNDLLIPDTIVEIPPGDQRTSEHDKKIFGELDAVINDIAQQKGIERGSKTVITEDESLRLIRACQKIRCSRTEAGGSTMIVLANLKNLLPNDVSLDFLGSVGTDKNSDVVYRGLGRADINLLTMPSTIEPKSAQSFIFIEPDGKRTVFTYPGNAQDIIVPNHDKIADVMAREKDVLFLSGTHWEKFPKKDDYGRTVGDLLVDARWEAGKHERNEGTDHEFWLALPTHADFGPELEDKFKFLIPSANLVLANGEELMRIYKQNTIDDALKCLQEDFDHSALKDPIWHGSKRQMGFVTLGDKCAVVTNTREGGRHYYNAPDNKPVFSALAADEAAFAGFAAAWAKQRTPDMSAQIAMAMAAAKGNYPDTLCVPEPLAALSPEMAQSLLQIDRSRFADSGGWPVGSGRG